ncbi:hypothetical protein LK09_15065 [Microbacterium mangrovi]|uniref:Major facilitator superfamily (MFS) profile domain-containing protein n=1 Tax=Microbacterium mangrovi TaxID=1348253 RepID=A0A0B1ZZH5_9MICO|nr:hypothetical protein [Microbacterium mangrovi]KHK96635.1 hypothetical protein LK09_15065 [Microbacterium mangrovi]
MGLGSTFTGNIRLLAEHVPNHERGGLFAAIYLVAYLAFGLPVIVAGLFISALGLTTISIVYAAVIAVSATIGLVLQIRVR